MNSELFRKYDFVTTWHLTDIANLPSIFKHGLMSRAAVINQGFKFQEVGWDKIVKTRENWTDNVLTFVTPKNNFVAGRLDKHLEQQPGAQGLCLLEIDLVQALDRIGVDAKISNGLISKFSFSPTVSTISNFEDILDWHALMDYRLSSTDSHVQFARGAEVLFSDSLPASCIRGIWFPDDKTRVKFLKLNLPVESFVSGDLFSSVPSSFPTGVQNFKFHEKGESSRIFHALHGDGDIIGLLGGRAVVDFDKSGLHLIQFREIWYP